MDDFNWSKTEKKIAREAFEKAYELECSDLIEKILVNLDAIHTLLGIPAESCFVKGKRAVPFRCQR